MTKKSHRVAKVRRMLLSLSLMLVTMVVAVGGTIAWLTDQTDQIVNTFTPTTIDIELVETKDEDDNTAGKQFQMIPGKTIEKDPTVKLIATPQKPCEAIHLFVKMTKSANFDSYMDYQIATGWEVVSGYTDLYYRAVDKLTAPADYPVLLNNEVTVKGEGVTKAMMDELTAETYPSLTFDAYAIQQANVSKTDAITKAVTALNAAAVTTGD